VPWECDRDELLQCCVGVLSSVTGVGWQANDELIGVTAALLPIIVMSRMDASLDLGTARGRGARGSRPGSCCTDLIRAEGLRAKYQAGVGQAFVIRCLRMGTNSAEGDEKVLDKMVST
jgi:hypothetical protein